MTAHCACGCTGCTAERLHAVRDLAVVAGDKYLRRVLEAIAAPLSVSPTAEYGAKANGVLLDDILAALDVPQEVRRDVI